MLCVILLRRISGQLRAFLFARGNNNAKWILDDRWTNSLHRGSNRKILLLHALMLYRPTLREYCKLRRQGV